MNLSTSFSIYSLGDSAITIDLGNCIDEQSNIRALAIYDWLKTNRIPGMADILVAYSSVSVFYDPAHMLAHRTNGCKGAYFQLKILLERAWEATLGGSIAVTPDIGNRSSDRSGTRETRHIRVPVCYEGEFAPDLEWVAQQKGITPSEVIGLHTNGCYRIYMVGFLPGFPYMGKTDPRLEIPRKNRPVQVISGGVGIAGRQTGIYPFNSPGGWQIIGRTPVRLFDRRADPPIYFQTGDEVRFYPVSKDEFRDLEGRPE